MLAATVGSALLGMWDEAALLVVLYGAAEGLEEYTYARTRASIRQLLNLAPKEAKVLKDGKEISLPAQQLTIGDVFVVRPGESIVTDGVIVKGRSSVNEAPVTGESVPVEKSIGMKVFSATMNQEGALEIKATASFQDNTLSKMVHLVEEAQEQKGKKQIFIERFGRIYTPLVLASAFILMLIPIFGAGSFAFWAGRAVVLLVAAAPCALIMSTPVAIAAGIGKAGESGVLIKGGAHLENLGKIKVVAFDKTGTLTRGAPVVVDVLPFNSARKPLELLSLAYGIEKSSEHPLARAICAKAKESGVQPLEATDFSALVGAGAKAIVENRTVYVGKAGLFESFGINLNEFPEIQRLRGEGKTVILLGTEKNIEGILAIREEIRPEAKKF